MDETPIGIGATSRRPMYAMNFRIVPPTSCRYPNREVFPKEMVMAAWVYANYLPAGPVKDFIAGMLSEAEYATNQTVDNELSQE